MAKTTINTERTIDDRVIKAIAHPLRQRLLHRLGEGVASPSELASDLDEPLNSVSYHIKILEKFGAIELVETRQVRSVIEHFYRPTTRAWIEEEHWSRLPLPTRRAFFDHLLQQIWEHVLEAAADEQLDDPKTHVTWTHLQLDDQAYEELSEVLNQVLDRAMKLEAEAAVRLAGDPDGEIHRTELAVLHYHRPAKSKRSSAPKRRARSAK